MTNTQPLAQEPAGPPDVDRAPSPSPEGRPRLDRWLARRWARVQETPEAGMSTAEYAVGTVAACAFAAVLYQVVTGGSVVTALGDLVQSALTTLS